MLIFSFFECQRPGSKDSGAIEPKNRFEIIINGKTYQVVEGQILTLGLDIFKAIDFYQTIRKKKF